MRHQTTETKHLIGEQIHFFNNIMKIEDISHIFRLAIFIITTSLKIFQFIQRAKLKWEKVMTENQ